jgi:type I restriction enzyme S subunit
VAGAPERYRIGVLTPVVDYVDTPVFDEELVLLGEDGAPFFDPIRPVAFRVTGPLWPNNHVHVLRPRKNVDARFMAYALNAVDYISYIDGATRDKLTKSAMLSIQLPSPSCTVQRSIADYLDQRTVAIDALIAKKEELLGVLERYREAVITQAVGREADGAVRRVKLKYALAGCYGGIWGDEPNGHEDIAVVRVADFDKVRGIVAVDGTATFRAIPASHRKNRLLREGDLLIEKSGGGELSPVGNVVLYIGPGEAVCSNFVARLQVKSSVEPRFMLYAFQALTTLGVNRLYIKQTSGIQNLDVSQYLNETIWLPEKAEQKKIAAYLDVKTKQIGQLQDKVKAGIDKLKKFRQSVVTHAVSFGVPGHSTELVRRNESL